MTVPISGAGTPERCNTFAIPVVTDHNGQDQHVVWSADGPLVPWYVHGHGDLWVPVDGTGEQLDYFRAQGPEPTAVASINRGVGFTVLVSGGKGVGKTTLIHKCVDSLVERLHPVDDSSGSETRGSGERWDLRRPLPGVRVVPISGTDNRHSAIWRDNGAAATVEQVNQRILDKVLVELRKDMKFQEEEGMRDWTGNVYGGYEATSAALVSLDQTLLIIVPDGKWRGGDSTQRFYRSCTDYALTNIVFFLESASSETEADLLEEFGDREDCNLIHLKIGDLMDEDWSRYLRARLAVRGIPGKHVRVAQEVLDQAPERRFWQNIRALQKFLDAIAQQAHNNQEEEIDLNRVRLYEQSCRPVNVLDFRRPS